MADGIFFRIRQFGNGLVPRWDKKNRIITESVFAAGGIDDQTFQATVCFQKDAFG
jgi:hypothetical protein